MDILTEFGVKPILLAAQIVNFLILLFLLKKFLYRPILKILDERKKKIAESIINAEQIKQELLEIQGEREKKLQQAAKEAKKIIEEAIVSANQIIAEAHQKAQTDIEKMIAKSEAQIASERDKLHQEIKAELADLVVLGMQKVAGKILSVKDKDDLTARAMKEFES